MKLKMTEGSFVAKWLASHKKQIMELCTESTAVNWQTMHQHQTKKLNDVVFSWSWQQETYKITIRYHQYQFC